MSLKVRFFSPLLLAIVSLEKVDQNFHAMYLISFCINPLSYAVNKRILITTHSYFKNPNSKLFYGIRFPKEIYAMHFLYVSENCTWLRLMPKHNVFLSWVRVTALHVIVSCLWVVLLDNANDQWIKLLGKEISCYSEECQSWKISQK